MLIFAHHWMLHRLSSSSRVLKGLNSYTRGFSSVSTGKGGSSFAKLVFASIFMGGASAVAGATYYDNLSKKERSDIKQQ